MTQEERAVVQEAFRSGAVSVLAATSTLAAGVNLPARRVIFKDPFMGLDTRLLSATSFNQMCGRAGRKGAAAAARRRRCRCRRGQSAAGPRGGAKTWPPLPPPCDVISSSYSALQAAQKKHQATPCLV